MYTKTELIITKTLNIVHLLWILSNFSSIFYISAQNYNTKNDKQQPKLLNILFKTRTFSSSPNLISFLIIALPIELCHVQLNLGTKYFWQRKRHSRLPGTKQGAIHIFYCDQNFTSIFSSWSAFSPLFRVLLILLYKNLEAVHLKGKNFEKRASISDLYGHGTHTRTP